MTVVGATRHEGQRPPAILFIDDERILLTTLGRALRHHLHWELVFALGGTAGVTMLQERRFDVVVTDYQMPDVRGDAVLDVAARLHPQARRIMLTASPVDETEVNAHRMLSKPFDVNVLRAVLAAAVNMPADQFALRIGPCV